MGDAVVSVTSKRLLERAKRDRKVSAALEQVRELLIVEP